jgi:hypothetical protein
VLCIEKPLTTPFERFGVISRHRYEYDLLALFPTNFSQCKKYHGKLQRRFARFAKPFALDDVPRNRYLT